MYLKHPAKSGEYTKVFSVYTTVLNYEMRTLLAKYTNVAKQLIVFFDDEERSDSNFCTVGQ